MRDLDDRRGEDRRDAAIDRVAARAHEARAGVHGERAAGGDDAVRGAHLAAHALGDGRCADERHAAKYAGTTADRDAIDLESGNHS